MSHNEERRRGGGLRDLVAAGGKPWLFAYPSDDQVGSTDIGGPGEVGFSQSAIILTTERGKARQEVW